MLKKARQADAGTHLADWANSSACCRQCDVR
jgi:hypothetical protein